MKKQHMKKKLGLLALAVFPIAVPAQTLDECQQAAGRNYPLIKRYGLLARTTELTVSNIRKEWLPQISVSAQATCQSGVASWPDGIRTAYRRMGLDMKGLSKDQYRAGIEVTQPLYDGGAVSSQAGIARRQGEVQEAENKVDLYQVRRRVNEMYFSLLLLDEQIRLNEDAAALLLSSEKTLSAMVRAGTAAASDLENVKAGRLDKEQQNTGLRAQRQMLRRMLGVFCGREIYNLQKPDAVRISGQTGNRPELGLFDRQLMLVDAQEKALGARLRPKVGLYAQGFYGYPGLNMFDDMMNRKWSLNGIIGVKLSWDVGALYTRKNDREKLEVQREQIGNMREVFLLNNRLEQIQAEENAARYRSMMLADDEIISLRTHVRKAAESKLAHGIIDTHGLMQEINNENAARIRQAIHEMDMLREMYNLKYTNNE